MNPAIAQIRSSSGAPPEHRIGLLCDARICKCHWRGVIAGEAALDLWDLSHVVPRVIDLIVETGYRPRKAGGETYRVRRRTLPLEAVDQVDGIAVLSPFATIQDCIQAGTSSREITKAIDTAQARELITRREAARLIVQLDGREGR